MGDEVVLYPNPTAGDFTVAFNAAKAGSTTIRVINGNNATLFSTSLHSSNGANQALVSGAALSSGIYFVHINFNDQDIVKKLVVR
jgi:hypothetical protein